MIARRVEPGYSLSTIATPQSPLADFDGVAILDLTYPDGFSFRPVGIQTSSFGAESISAELIAFGGMFQNRGVAATSAASSLQVSFQVLSDVAYHLDVATGGASPLPSASQESLRGQVFRGSQDG